MVVLTPTDQTLRGKVAVRRSPRFLQLNVRPENVHHSQVITFAMNKLLSCLSSFFSVARPVDKYITASIHKGDDVNDFVGASILKGSKEDTGVRRVEWESEHLQTERRNGCRGRKSGKTDKFLECRKDCWLLDIGRTVVKSTELTGITTGVINIFKVKGILSHCYELQNS